MSRNMFDAYMYYLPIDTGTHRYFALFKLKYIRHVIPSLNITYYGFT